jgi:hypothetical protein
MENCPSQEVSSRSATEEVNLLLVKTEVHYRVTRALFLTSSWAKWTQWKHSIHLYSRFTYIFTSYLRLSLVSCSLPSGLPTMSVVCTSGLKFLDLINLSISNVENRSWSSPLCTFLPLPAPFSYLRIFSWTTLSRTPQICFPSTGGTKIHSHARG